jgi:hypothetical protein
MAKVTRFTLFAFTTCRLAKPNDAAIANFSLLDYETEREV